MKNIIKKEEGITLVALVTTIIILLILSGITIGTLASKKGLINEANQSSEAAQKESIIEKIEADLYSEKTITGKIPDESKLIEIAAKYGIIDEIDQKITIAGEYDIFLNEISGWDNSVNKNKFHANKIVFNGTNYLNTGISLFSEENMDKDFEISFKISKINKKNNLLINKEIDEINDINSNDDEKIFFEPKKVWSLKKEKKINVDDFFEDCTQIWPFDECCFIKEIALEFLMKKNYSVKYCLDNIKEFVFFMKKRAKELDFPIISDSVKTIKKYHLRKTNYN